MSFFSLVSKLSVKERRRKITRVLMIEDTLNLQNKKTMKTDIKVEFLYSFIHARCVSEFFTRTKNPWNFIFCTEAILVLWLWSCTSEARENRAPNLYSGTNRSNSPRSCRGILLQRAAVLSTLGKWLSNVLFSYTLANQRTLKDLWDVTHWQKPCWFFPVTAHLSI